MIVLHEPIICVWSTKKLPSKYLNEGKITLKYNQLFTNLHYVVYMTCEKYKTEHRID